MVLKITESGVMIALSTVLSLITIGNLPFGGSVTLCSLLPLVIIGYRYGTKWGIFSGVVYGFVQMVLGIKNLSYGTSFLAVAVIILFDYIIAFGAMGCSGLFREKIKNQAAAMGVGCFIGCLLRYFCHCISGVTVWAHFAEEVPVWYYAITYNAAYMVPETIVTVAGVIIVSAFLNFSTPTISPMKSKNRNCK